jgi:hypothetical protein
MVINKKLSFECSELFSELHVNQTKDALKEYGIMKTLRCAFMDYQGNVLADDSKFTKRVMIQELFKEYRCVQVYFHNMSFHFSPVKISPYRVKNYVYRLCLEENSHLTINSL